MSWLVDKKIVKHLKCSACGCYLSVNPITFSENSYYCGRCRKEEKNEVTIFKILAQACKFPCRYDVNGCNLSVSFGEEMSKHENLCAYRPTSCLLKQCEWRGYVNDLVSHFSINHQKNIADSLDFEADITKSMSVLKLTKFKNGQLLLLQVLYDRINGLKVELSPIIEKGLPGNYSLIITSIDEQNTSEFKNNEILKPPKPLLVPTVTLQSISKSQIRFMFLVDSNLKQCPCFSCGQNISLYFFTCIKNHYLCLKCNKNFNCTECNTLLKIKSNYQLMEESNVPNTCCNAIYECNFAGTVEKLKEHEKDCIYDKCLVSNCSWQGVSTAFIKHVKLKHTDVTHKNRELSIGVKDEIVQFIKMDDQMFVVKTNTKQEEHLQELTVNLINNYSKNYRKWKVMVTLQENSLLLVGDVPQLTSDFKLDFSYSLHMCTTLLQNYRSFKVILYHTI